MKTASRLSAAVLGAILITGCAARGVHIADLQNRPDKWDNKTVSVNGVVTSSFGIPLVPFQLYKIDDGSGEIIGPVDEAGIVEQPEIGAQRGDRRLVHELCDNDLGQGLRNGS